MRQLVKIIIVGALLALGPVGIMCLGAVLIARYIFGIGR